MTHHLREKWINWSGSIRFSPAVVHEPADEVELAELVKRANENGKLVRVAGAGHSSMPIMATDDVLISMQNFKQVESVDVDRQEAVIGSGMTVHEAGQALHEHGLALHNTGDIDKQTIAGAVATATHGTGQRLQNLATLLVGAKMVTGAGEIVECTMDNDSSMIPALRVSLGVLGIFTTIRIRLLPRFQLHRRELCTRMDDCLAHLDELIEENRNFDFYWYPRSDQAKIRLLNPPGEGTTTLPYATMDKEYTGWSADVLPRHRELRFEEMEYALPREAGPECFQEIRKRVKERWRHIVGWRVLYRTIAADDAYLSTAYGRDTVTISLHQNASLPFWEYFKDIEPIFRAYDGRPHWGKKHTLYASELAPLYPKWEQFKEVRRRFDPNNCLLNPYLRKLLEA